MPKKIPLLLLSVGLCLGAGFIGTIFTTTSIPTWYVILNKPFFSPPNWLFGPVWTLLYIMMGVALYLVISDKKKAVKEKAIQIFVIQLILNVAWSIIFFGLKNPAVALVDIVALWIGIYFTIKSFYKINRLAGNLLVPYLLWVSFATILNLSIVILNP